MNILPKRLFGFLALLFWGKSSAAPPDAGLRAFQSLRRQAETNGLQNMSMDEINAEITKYRSRKRK